MGFNEHPDYKDLPKPVRSVVSPKEHAWLGDKEKAELVSDICNPDDAEDDDE